MSFPPLAGGDHIILSSEYCSGYSDVAGVWNTGFYCPQTGSTRAVHCCGTPSFKYCCVDKPPNGTGAGIVDINEGMRAHEDGIGATVSLDAIDDYSGATRMRPVDDQRDLSSNDLSSLNLSDVPIIFGVACGVAAVLILVILVGFYLTSCCAHYHQLHQNRKRRSSLPGIYRGATSANASTSSGLVNLYSPTNSGGGGQTPAPVGIIPSRENPQTYVVHPHHHVPPASPDSISTADHYQIGPNGGSTSLVTTPLDIEWSSTAHLHHLQQQNPQNTTSVSASQLLQQSHPLDLFSGGVCAVDMLGSNLESRIHYTVHQTQNRLAVALTGSMNRLSDRPSPCPTPGSAYQVNIPLTPPDGYSYPRQSYHQQSPNRSLSPPPQYSSAILPRSDSPPYYPSYDSGSSSNTTDNQQHNYLSRTSTLPLSLSRKPPTGCNRPLLTSPGPYGSTVTTPQQPKSILRTSQNYRRVVTNETPPPIPPHHGGYGNEGSYSVDSYTSGSIGNITYRNVDSRTNLNNQPLLLLESKVDNSNGETEAVDLSKSDGNVDNIGNTSNVRRSSIASSGINVAPTQNPEEDDERRDHFDIHDIDSDALSRLIEMDLDSKL